MDELPGEDKRSSVVLELVTNITVQAGMVRAMWPTKCNLSNYKCLVNLIAMLIQIYNIISMSFSFIS